MLYEPNKIKAVLKVKAAAEFYDDEATQETLRSCVEQALEDAGFEVYVSVLKKPEPPHWISVKDGIPKNDQVCLTVGPRGVMRVAKAYVPAQALPKWSGDPNTVWWYCESREVAVAYWMPRPEPPEASSCSDSKINNNRR